MADTAPAKPEAEKPAKAEPKSKLPELGTKAKFKTTGAFLSLDVISGELVDEGGETVTVTQFFLNQLNDGKIELA